MKRVDAEQLLGGHATGTLTEGERQILFAAALEHQDLFDALVDEEALRDLLTDPEARAQLLVALAPAAPKVVPFWRRTGVLGAAASLIVAATAGLAYWRSPGPMPPPVQEEAAKVPAAKAVEAPPGAPVPARKVAPPAPAKVAAAPLRIMATEAPAAPAPQSAAAGAPIPVLADAARERNQAEYRRADVQDSMAKKAEAPRPVPAAVMEVIGAISPPPEPKAKALGGAGLSDLVPVWSLDLQPDGSTRVRVAAPRGPQAILLKRGASGIEVLRLQAIEDRPGASVQWRGRVRLAAGDVLDLYLMNGPVADPARLPETGPVDGFRARIHPAAK
ncbi:MAG: hypothetical protein Q8K67_02925 [Geothrix sp.]|nr:hypothetical protein [Geothrix sp.]